jgi:uncharacterized protein YndB with AHSA1/START domain
VTQVRHETFTLSRHLSATPGAVFAAFADDAVRRRWFRLPGSGAVYEHVFAVGGGETARSTFAGADAGPERLEYRLHYLDIAPDRRIVYSYETRIDDTVRWAALTTVELTGDTEATLLEWTEQVAFLTRTGDGGADLPHLRGGTALRLNGLEAALATG